MDRITIAYSNKRGLLEPILREEQKKHPTASCVLDGQPGNWKVRRDAQKTDDLSTYRARDLRRGV
jgi:hypothetical protein